MALDPLLVADTSLQVRASCHVLNRIIQERGKPRMIVSNHGSEFTSHAILQWTDPAKIDWHHVLPCKLIQNAFIESSMVILPPINGLQK